MVYKGHALTGVHDIDMAVQWSAKVLRKRKQFSSIKSKRRCNVSG